MSARSFIAILRTAAIAACLLLAPLPALATPAIVDFQTIGYQNNLASENRTIGWIFTALDDVAVTHLGVWDHAGDGLVASHLTGIWDAGGALLGSSTVPSGTAATPVGGPVGGGLFRYVATAPIVLTAGATYTIGALFDSNDVFEFYPVSVTTGSSVAYGEERFGDEGAGFVFPTDTYMRWGLYGPNFLYARIAEPSAVGSMLLALVALACAAIRRFPRPPAR